MKAKFLFIFSFFIPLFSFAQVNLVPNPSFEDYSQCPYDENQVHFAIGWKSYCATPEYFNSCATNFTYSVPYNLGGSYQLSASGNAYCGIFTYFTPTFIGGDTNVREHIGIELDSPLLINHKYYVSFKVSLAYNNVQLVCASNNLGMKFSTVSFDIYGTDSITSPAVNNISHINFDSVISDTTGWTNVTGSIIADSAYNYVMIGNFYTDSNTDTLILDPLFPYCYSYYYIDDVCVSTDSLYCANWTNINEIINLNQIEIFPNPFYNSINIKLNDSKHVLKAEIFNIEGKLIYAQSLNSNQNTLMLEKFNPGIYLLIVNINQNKFRTLLVKSKP